MGGTQWGALRLSREGPTLYTTDKKGSALRMFVSDLRFSIVPDEAASSRRWSRPYDWLPQVGIGVNQEGGVIWMMVPGGPGEAAGLKVGDRILQIDRNPISWIGLFGPVGTPVVLTVQRQGQPEPFEVTVTRKDISSRA